MCFVAAVRAWQQRCHGAPPNDCVLQKVSSVDGSITDLALADDSISSIVKKATQSVRLRKGFSVHSVNVGFVSGHARKEHMGVGAIMQQTRHRSLATVQR